MHDDMLFAVAPASEVDQTRYGDQRHTVGRFEFFIDDERWQWSEEVQLIHGYAGGEMPNPTTREVLAHKHPDDYEHVRAALQDSLRTRAPFSSRHRMIDKRGREHRIAVVGDVMRDAMGSVIGTQGFYIDVTPAEAAVQARITEGVTEVSNKRAVIEQAKGMLAVVYGLEDDAAFELLKWLSQRSNTKLRAIAQRLVEQFRALSAPVLPARNVYDEVLMGLCRR
ncbi:PAS and ANTAR domain-containing protein [Mycobacterium sp.]|uniref:PAS and ANTAR domain-containing protein n=1 Tax=Mycobacterium sp. TaxID=1785 RepID=UPI0025FC2279|nr:PAS and ANTAR domain-containing protein [Mycobacterium sp.]